MPATYQAYVELGSDGSALAWVLDLPGCHGRGQTVDQALARLEGTVAEWLQVFRGAAPGPVTLAVAEQVPRRRPVGSGATSAAFGPDLAPMSRAEAAAHIDLLDRSRRWLLEMVEGLPEAALHWEEPGRPAPWHTIGGQLRHVAAVERWYLEQFWRRPPAVGRCADVWDRLRRTRAMARAFLAAVPDADLGRAERYNGEMWTLRKVFRRLLYHEWFHGHVIARMRAGWESGLTV